MRFLVSFIVIFAGCVVSLPSANPSISADLGTRTALALIKKSRSPDPDPQPGDICPNCRGKGYVGDSVVRTKCLPCDGTGRVLPSALVVPGGTCPDGGCDP